MNAHVFRLTRGQDLLLELENYAGAHAIEAAVVVSAVGCLYQWRLRDASGVDVQAGTEDVELLSLNGTVSRNGCHLHLAVARQAGLAAFGGHLLPGCKVNTTVEVALLSLPGLRFTREPDPQTGYGELCIHR